jgi:hypothetical protein
MRIDIVRSLQCWCLLTVAMLLTTACGTAPATTESRLIGRWQSIDQIYYTLDGNVDAQQPDVTLTYDFFEDGTFRRQHTTSFGDVVFRGTFSINGGTIVFDVLNQDVPEEIRDNLAHITRYENEFTFLADKLTLVTIPTTQFSKIETIYNKLS